jgi:hypothetical protein
MVPAGAAVEPGASSAYFGTSGMFMVGDLPGLSKCCWGAMGSYQYRGLRSASAVFGAPGAAAPEFAGAVAPHFGTSCMSMKGDLPGLSKC